MKTKSITITIPVASPSNNLFVKKHWSHADRWVKDTGLLFKNAIQRAGGLKKMPKPGTFVHMKYERFGKRLLDQDNLAGGAKYMIDFFKPAVPLGSKKKGGGLYEGGIIADDDPKNISITFINSKDFHNPRTEITLSWEVADLELVMSANGSNRDWIGSGPISMHEDGDDEPTTITIEEPDSFIQGDGDVGRAHLKDPIITYGYDATQPSKGLTDNLSASDSDPPNVPNDKPKRSQGHSGTTMKPFTLNQHDAMVTRVQSIQGLDSEGDRMIKARISFEVTLLPEQIKVLPVIAKGIKEFVNASKKVKEGERNTIVTNIRLDFPVSQYTVKDKVETCYFNAEIVNRPKVSIVDGDVTLSWTCEGNLDQKSWATLGSLTREEGVNVTTEPEQKALPFAAVG